MPPITSLSQLDLSKRYTYADYLTWQFDEFVELIKGKVSRMSPAPRVVHQDILLNISAALKYTLRGRACRPYVAPFDVRLNNVTPNGDSGIATVVQPDICVICDPAKVDAKGCAGAPDWIIEILSPGNATHDIRVKFDLYEENGVGEYWIVFPDEKNVAAYVLTDGRYQLRGEFYQPGPIPVHTLLGFSLEWDEVFEGV
ncbi:Uma2 family endonuclease [Hymenobacter sp. BT507]|uniref:Uma2 family endonuclease n=1 Tax=Hymenobacter citatus TaxID=2763506 RepID=A0ABR7MNX4_9BACT|nr:Uma2 family endonuclease [Hymenobacter citatus]MBC6612765.1 Uma2 family endonuclease [Hymenobacter citatus]